MTVLTMATWVPRATPLATAIDAWAADLAATTNGALDIEVFHAGELVGALEVNDAVASGTVDLGLQILNPLTYPDLAPAGFPFVAPVTAQSAVNLFRNLPADPFAAQAQTLLAASFGEPHILVSREELSGSKAFDGLKIYASGVAGELVNKLGGIAQNLPVGELFNSLATGSLDAALLPASLAAELELWRVADNVLTFENDVAPTGPASLLTINSDTLAALPEAIADLLTGAMGAEFSARLGALVADTYQVALETLAREADNFATFTGPSADDFRGAAEDYIDLRLSTADPGASVLYTALLQLVETGTPGADIITGSDGADVLKGLGGRDLIRGTKGDDVIEGGAGNDRLFGGAGRDTIEGGAGDDLLVGNRGADVFVFAGRFGQDRIRDFDTGARREDIDLSAVGEIRGWRDLRADHLEQVGADVVITAGANSITLLGVDLDDLGRSDFLF